MRARPGIAGGRPWPAPIKPRPAPEPFSPPVRMSLDEFPIYCDGVREANELDGITVLLGVEADYHYHDGCEGFLEEWLPQQDLDYVLGSVHFNGYDRDNNHTLTGVYNDKDVEGSWTEYFCRIRLLADTGLYNVVGHLDLPKRKRTLAPLIAVSG